MGMNEAGAAASVVTTLVEHPFGWFPHHVAPHAAERGWVGPDADDLYDTGTAPVEFEIIKLRGHTKEPINGIVIHPPHPGATREELSTALDDLLGPPVDDGDWPLPDDSIVQVVHNLGWAIAVYPPVTL